MSDQSCFYRTAPRGRVHRSFGVLLALCGAFLAANPASVHAASPAGRFEPDPWTEQVDPLLDQIWQFIKCSGDIDPGQGVQERMADLIKCIASASDPAGLAPEQRQRLERDVHTLYDLLPTAPDFVSRELVFNLELSLERLLELLASQSPAGVTSRLNSSPASDLGLKHHAGSVGSLMSRRIAARSTPDKLRSSPAATIPDRIDTNR